MSKIMMLELSMQDQGPILRLVSVEDPVEFIGTYRAAVLTSVLTRNPGNVLQFIQNQEGQEEFLRKLVVRLRETGLEEIPDTSAELNELYRRFGD